MIEKGILCAWFDITPERCEDWRQWHSGEHMPERLSLAGFKRGRRFIACDGAPHFFVLYEVESTAVLGSEAYLERLNNPTAWTLASSSAFSNNCRATFRLVWSRGTGVGGFLLAIRFASISNRQWDDPCNRCLLDNVQAVPGVCGVNLAYADDATTDIKTVESSQRSDSEVGLAAILLVEASSEDILRRLSNSLLSSSALTAPGMKNRIQASMHQLEFCLTSTDLDARQPMQE
jgi:hypothetical protein